MKKFIKLFSIALLISSGFSLNAQVSNIDFGGEQPSCFMQNDGFLVFKGFDFVPGRPAGPIPSFRFAFPGTPPTLVPINIGDTIKNLVSGSYFIEVIDNGAYYREDTTLSFITSISSFLLPTDVSCFGESDGGISLFPNGGNGAPFTFQWDDPAMSTTQNISNVAAGGYNVTVTDSKGCIAVATDTVRSPSQIAVNLTIDSVDCGGGTATATIAPSGGSGTFTGVEWSNSGATNSFVEAGLAGSLAGIPYSVTVTDNSGCTAVESFNIVEPLSITLTIAPDTIDCFGTSAGEANATVVGGTAPFTFNWGTTPGTGNANIRSGLPAGSYGVTVTDANGCPANVNFPIEQRDELNLGLDSIDVTCNGDGNGSISGTITGGVSPYSWIANDPAATTGNTAAIAIPNLNGGTFRVSVTDNLGCVKVDSIVVNEPPALIANFTGATEPSCVGGTDGTISVSFSGGNGTETFTWNGTPFGTVNRTGLGAGNYTLRITDSKGCFVEIDTVLVDPAPILANLTFDPPACLGGNNGRAIATPSGGSGIYTNYAWSSALGTDSIEDGLIAGTYTVTITDSDGCTGNGTVTVTEPTNLFEIDIVADSVNCNGESTGGAIATPRAPLTIGDYTWAWSDAGGAAIGTGDSIVTGLAIGTYTVTATDGNGCEIIRTVLIEEPDPISTVVVGTNLNCNGDASGTATATISNGNTPYSWSWSTTPPQTGTGATATATGLDANTKYFITVTDREGCTKLDSVTLTEPVALTATINTQTDPLCNGDNNGQIQVDIAGGTPGYTYAWSDAGSPAVEDRTLVGAGTYTLTVTDANNCAATVSATLTDPAAVVATIDSLADISCNGANDGFARLTVTGGTAPFTFSWPGSPGITTGTNPGLNPGTIIVTATDANGCTGTVSVTIAEPTVLTANATATPASCSGQNDGTANVTEAGGTPGYTYLWDDANAQTTATANNLVAGTYNVTVTDDNGCQTTASAIVTEPITITLTTTQNNVTCFGDATGDATVVPVGGTAPLTFAWSTVPVQTNATATALIAGTYDVTVTDANGCNETETVIITEPNQLMVDSVTSVTPTCNGLTDGSITVNGIDGTPGYTFQWDAAANNQTTAQASNLGTGTYTVTVTDIEGCFAIRTFNVVSPPSIDVSDTNIVNVSCFGANDGSIKVITSGGTAPITFAWSPTVVGGVTLGGTTSDSLFNAPAGTYNLTVTDNRGCFEIETYTITEPIDGVTMTFDTTDVSCTGADNGTAKVNPTGGTPPYSFVWRNMPFGFTTDSISRLATGTYIVDVTDANGCVGTDSTVINPAAIITLAVDPANPVQDVTCAGADDGTIDIIAGGGSGNLSFDWFLLPNRTTPIATNTLSVSNLSGGTYRIIVIDGPCLDSIDVVVNEPDTLKAELFKSDLSCDGTVLGNAVVRNITGGNAGGQSFLWTPDPGVANGQGTDSVFNLAAGNYSVRVFDALGCDTTINFDINSSNATFTFTDSVRNDSCQGSGNGYIEIIGIAGGVAPYTYDWSTNPGVPTADAFIDNLLAGNYSVTITDNAGCDSVQTFIVTEPTPITATITSRPDTCGNGVGNADITSIAGGTPPYITTWPGTSGNVNGTFVDNLTIGNYLVTVTDANSCATILPFNIGNVAPFTIGFDVDSVNCEGFPSGSISVTTSASAANPITYNWSPSIPGGATPTGLFAGEYRLTVTDANGCEAVDTTEVFEPALLEIDSVQVTDESCFPGSDGTALAFVKGGTPPYRYNWGGGLINADNIANLPAGNYRLGVQDKNLCSASLNFVIGSSAPFSFDTPTVVDASCRGFADGSITVNLIGAVAPITYTWGLPGLSGPSVTGLRRGSYGLTVTDGTGCSVSTSIPVDEVSSLQAIISLSEDETCAPGGDGWAKVGATQGIEPYTYLWSNNVIDGLTTDSAFNLASDDYIVTVTDANACTAIARSRIESGANIGITIIAQTPPTCFGDRDASITIDANGGVAPYTYAWSDPANSTTASVSNLRAGIYSVTITDSSNPPCEKVESITITPNDPLSLTIATGIESCIPGNDGDAVVSVTGGVSPFTFNYSPGGTVGSSDNIYEGLSAGNYSVTVTDANGCQRDAAFTISDANSFSINLTKKNPTCANGNDGEFFVALSGGVNPFTYNWTGGLSGADPKNASAGEYTIVVTDAFGCTASVTDTLFSPAPITATFAIVDETCTPGNDGSATAAAADGLAPYTFTWPNITGAIPSGNTITNVPAGTYTVTVTDANNCSQPIPFTVGSSAPFTVVTAQNNVSCKGLTDGDITVSVTGVTTPNTETYLWTPNVGAANISNPSQSNLAAGTYGLTITDPGNNCVETETFIITEPDTLDATAIVTNVSCTGAGADGTIDLTVTGGTAPYFYDWGNGVASEDRSNLTVGTYNVIITDDNNCVYNASFVVDNLPQFTVSLDSVDISCPGANDGFISVTTDATNPSFLWDDGNRDQIRGALLARKYFVTVTDGISGCTIVDSTTINEEDSIKMFFTVTEENCFPGMDGIARIDSTRGGTPTYTFNFSGGNRIGSDVVNQLSAGTYFVTATDANRCTAVDSFRIDLAAPFNVTFVSTDAICNGDSSGTASVITSNSTGPLNFEWPIGSVVNRFDSTQNRLIAGTYRVTVSDPSNGCEEVVNIVINQPDTINPNAVIQDENCNPGGNGTITLATTGGDNGPYTYNWAGNGVLANAQDQINLSAGKYFVTITDGLACTQVDSFTVGFIVTTVPNLTTINDGCLPSGICAGVAQVNPTGGVAPYTYQWASVVTGTIPVSPTTDSIGQLCAGDYTVTITDASGCDTTIAFTIIGKRVIIPNAVVEDETCGITANGSVSVTPTGGQEPYTYTWLNSTAIDSNRTNLAPGSYTVTIADATGCDTVVTVVVGTENFDYTITKTDLSCSGLNDGTADIAITGGAAGFTFDWSPAPAVGAGTANISSLLPGTYAVTITNTNNGCAIIETVDIRPTTPIDPNETVTDESCFGQNDGSILLNTIGGAGGYTYVWSNNVPVGTTTNPTGLSAGTYDVTITDATGICDTSISITIGAANDIIAQITTNDASCTNSGICDGSAELMVTSTGVFSYTWTPGIVVVGNDSAAINLCPGNYSVTITNTTGCSKVENFTIGGPTLIAPNVVVTNSTCNITNGALAAAPTGGTGTLTVEWLDNSFTSIGTGNSINNLAAGAYFVAIADAVGCTDTFPTNVNDIGAETITISASSNVSCFGGNDGSATVSFTCNDPSCTTEWFRAGGISVGTGRSISGLTAGDYYVEVSNNSGCLAVETLTLTEPNGLSITESIVSNTCASGVNGSISLSVSGGAGGFTYVWTPSPTTGQGTNTISGLASGTYSVDIIDANGCDSTMSFDITDPVTITSTFVTTSSNCNQNDGQIVATVTGGTVATPLAYDYQWLDASNQIIVGATTDTLRNVGAGNYRLRVRDDNSCQQLFNVSLSDLNGPTVIVDSVFDAGCFGENNGGIFITVSGNNPQFTYNWSPTGAVSEDITNLTAGFYAVQVTDDLGCITNTDTVIQESTELMANISTVEATCGECNGTASASITGGTSPYTYLWSNGATVDNTDSLCGGNYTLVVTDANGCSKAFDFGVNTIGGPTGETVSITAASCSNSNDGSATVTPIGGTPPYSYLWQHNGARTNTLSNLSAGTYFVQISDLKSCSRTVQIDITSPTAIVLNPQIVSSTCNQADGSILLNVTGGLAPYSYDWGTATFADTNFIDNRAAGLYTVNVTDANGCVESATIAINNTGLPFTPNPIVDDVTCYGQCDGSLNDNIQIPGVVNFIWLDDQLNSIAPVNVNPNAVCAGDYFLELTTIADGCISYFPVTVDEPDSITLSSNIVKDISCAGDTDGEIFINTRGGNILYNYSWSNPALPNQIPASGLGAGAYTVTATDANGCTAETSVTLTDPPVLVASIDSNTDLLCSSDCNATATTTVSGGQPSYEFYWNDVLSVQNPTNLCFGPNVFKVIDTRGCEVTEMVMIAATDTVIAEATGPQNVCDGELVVLDGDTTGASITSIEWRLADTTTVLTRTAIDTSFARPVNDYTYFLIAFGGTANTCNDTAQYDVNVAPIPEITLDPEIRRFGDDPTTIRLDNGSLNYTYKWTPSTDLSSDSVAEPVTVSEEDITYTVFVTDTTTGCTYLDSVPLFYLPNIEVPSGFTPNGDGNNDVWNIRLLEKFPNASVQIFNRWGTLLYEQPNGYARPWDGKYDGKNLPIGTYYYIIDVKDPAVKPFSGPITIIK